jgi:K+-transporting ATPase KdpF subunit
VNALGLLALVSAVGLLIYLVVSLVRAEKF